MPSSKSKTKPQNLTESGTPCRVVIDPDMPHSFKHLSLAEKVRLLKITCKHSAHFLHCPTSGKHPEEEVWTSVMEEFSATVRAGVFTKFHQVKKANNKTCRNWRQHTKGTVPPKRRSRMGDLDTWIDRWVRVWKCRDLVVNIANTHQSIRETIGEKKLKRIFRHRMDSNELPQGLWLLTFSALLLKAIQKRIRVEQWSLKNRHLSLFPDEDESDWRDEDESEDGATVEPVDGGTPIPSIEDGLHDDPSLATLEEPSLNPSQGAERELDFPDPSPRTRARLDQFEQSYATVLKEERDRTGK
ncbi:hypothetical protein F4804DRAFT_326498 [Jackrogersella minutella]|nr:hypothetical protein F4804DRAFT_326498 [Jackrogersella minutella]